MCLCVGVCVLVCVSEWSVDPRRVTLMEAPCGCCLFWLSKVLNGDFIALLIYFIGSTVANTRRRIKGEKTFSLSGFPLEGQVKSSG